MNSHGDTATAYCFSAAAPLDATKVDAAIRALQSCFGADLLRLKGLAEIAGHACEPLLMHVVGHLASPFRHLPDWPRGISETRIVMIVSGPTRSEAARLMTDFLPELIPFGAAPPELAEEIA
ncbi:MAG: GTP-binding protein [Pseudomonadota bacterium]